MEEMKYRMYHLTMYNISDIQKGIQSYHAGMEYALKYWETPEFQTWARRDKVVYILNGGTSNNNGESEIGSMEQHIEALMENQIPHAPFFEPDLNDSLSGIAFLADERVWDEEQYPDPEYSVPAVMAMPKYLAEIKREALRKELEKHYDPQVAFLRTWLKKFRFA